MTVSQSSADSYKSTFAAQGITDSSGTCTIQLPQIPGGSYATGTILVFDSPNGIRWSVIINGITKDILLGPASTSGIQIGVSDTLLLVATGLVPGSIFHTTFDAVVSPESDTNLVTTAHDPLFITGENLNQIIQTIPISVVPTAVGVPIPVNVASLTLFFEDSFMVGLFSVTGATTGVVYYSNFAMANAQGMVSPISFDVSPDIDPVVLFNFGAATSSPMYVRANSQLSGENTPSWPLFISETDPAPRINFAGIGIFTGTGTTTTLLAAPPAGFYNEIKALLVAGATTVAAPTNFARIQGLSSGAFILGVQPSANGQSVFESFNQFYINEGLQAVNGWAVSCNFVVWSRVVPIANSY